MEMPDKTAQNYKADFVSWGRIDRGTLVIDPELANLGIEGVLDRAGLNFDVQLVQNFIPVPNAINPDGSQFFIPGNSHSVLRADTWTEIGYGMSAEYQPISYLNALSDIFGDLRKLDAVPSRAVSFRGGARAAIQFIIPDATWKIQDREHKLFFNTYGSHDGTMGVVANSSDICIVCGNTYRMSLADKTLRYSFRHTTNISQRLNELGRVLFGIKENAAVYYGILDKASTLKADENTVKQFLLAMVPDKEKNENQRQNSGPANRREEIYTAIGQTAAESNHSDFSIYDLMAGVTHYTSYRTQKRDSAEQFEYVTSGQGDKMNQAAYNWLAAYVKENAK